jgi:hypothetical protein
MARPRKKHKCQEKVTTDNQQVNVVANEEEIEVKQIIIFYTPILKVNLDPTPILESKFVVMDDTFHMIGFKSVM